MGNHAIKPKSGSSTKGQSATQTVDKVAFGDFKFANIELNKEHKDRFRSLQDAGEFEPFEAMDSYLEAGYKVSFNKDKTGGGVICSVACNNSSDPNAGFILVGRGGSAIVAWNVFRYKTLYLCEDQLWQTGVLGTKGADDIG